MPSNKGPKGNGNASSKRRSGHAKHTAEIGHIKCQTVGSPSDITTSTGSSKNGKDKAVVSKGKKSKVMTTTSTYTPPRTRSGSTLKIGENYQHVNSNDRENADSDTGALTSFRQEISKLKKIVNEQRNKIKSLEKRTRELNDRDDMLEDAVNDLYDFYEEYEDENIMDKDASYVEDLLKSGNLIMTDDGIYMATHKNSIRYNDDTDGDEDLEMLYRAHGDGGKESTLLAYLDDDSEDDDPDYVPGHPDADDEDNNTLVSVSNLDNTNNSGTIVDMTEDEYMAAADAMAAEEAKVFIMQNGGKRSTRSSNNTSGTSDKVDITTDTVKKGKKAKHHNKGRKSHDNNASNNSKNRGVDKGKREVSSQVIDDKMLPPSLRNVLRKSMQKSNPTRYVNEICDEQNASKNQRKELQRQVKEYLELSKKTAVSMGDSDTEQVTDLDHFISTEPVNRRAIISNLKEMIDNGAMKAPAPYKFRIIASGMDSYTKQIALYKANQLDNIQPGTGEYYKLKNWLDTLLDIPWGKYHSLDVSQKEIAEYLCRARSTMDEVIYGQDETKDIIIQIISKMLSNPDKCGNVFAIYGPPGVGKTTIIKEGMSRALGIPFSFISLGGATDSSYLDGHGYTYEGSTPGKIVEIIKKAKCLNPIIYFDELDKISGTRKGEEVANILVHLTDRSQNTLFHDKYLGNIPIDLSKAVYVFSFNDITKVNPILLDRMELIYVKGFTEEEKMIITKDYLLPEVMHTYCLDAENNGQHPFVAFSEDNIRYIIKYGDTNPEPHSQVQDLLIAQGLYSDNANPSSVVGRSHGEGVRQIKRRIEKICGQLNIVKLTGGKWDGPIHSTLDKIPELRNMDSDGTLHLDNTTIDKLLKIRSTQNLHDLPPSSMYM